ncbi:hypothetical protein PCL_07018 [Purpureocillium lilacinum]|uniref:DUF7730 domain-containing protein n=1 Tax=Purpureocillium lilacinum TaxID=33203 RepID=A0A2U3DT39_PURLI|nr:hypothetical protein PCL_07018 [Purpureocillium lilacinum]
MPSDDGPNRLMKLPFKVRLMIYELLVPPKTALYCTGGARDWHWNIRDDDDDTKRHWGEDTPVREEGLRAMLSLGSTSLSMRHECLRTLYRHITFHFDDTRKMQSVLSTHDRDTFLRDIRGVHLSCDIYTEENIAFVLELSRANPCCLHLCGMGGITDGATQRTRLPSSKTTLERWLLGASRSLSQRSSLRLGAAFGRAR